MNKFKRNSCFYLCVSLLTIVCSINVRAQLPVEPVFLKAYEKGTRDVSGKPGKNLLNGSEVVIKNNKKPALNMPSTAKMQARKSTGYCLLNNATSADHKAKIVTHNSKDPSCAPHTAAI